MTRDEVIEIIEQLRRSARHESCWACDCLQGLLVQLEMDADSDIADLVGPLKVEKQRMHGCLGCDPCPPGAVYADYLRGASCCGPCCKREEHD